MKKSSRINGKKRNVKKYLKETKQMLENLQINYKKKESSMYQSGRYQITERYCPYIMTNMTLL